MLVLGVTDGITCGAAIVRDGVVVAAVNEEALCRLKMAYGFPRLAIAEVMRIAGVGPQDLDLAAVAEINNHLFDGIHAFDGWLQTDRGKLRGAVFQAAGRLSFLANTIPGAEALYYKIRAPIFAKRRRDIKAILKNEFAIEAPVEFVNHHLTHATSAYFTSGFKDAMVVSMDGGGDGDCAHIYDVRDGHFNRITATKAFNSVGNYYAYVTHICGYKAQKHEGKITGLAAYGEPRYVDLLNAMITIENGALRNKAGVVFHAAIAALEKRLPRGWKKEDLAASIQKHCEYLAVEYIRAHRGPDTPPNLAIAGGLFANVRINQEVSEIEGVEQTFVHPGMTDCGLAVGAALAPCMANRKDRRMAANREVVDTVYLGPGYTDLEIEAALEAAGLDYTKLDAVEDEIGRLLAEGYVVARFNGRMEYGPRALGNRSILYHPTDRSVNDWLNELLNRTEFMPFAPSTLDEFAERYYHRVELARDAARFMTVTFHCTQQMKDACPGVVHIDGTARPQVVRAQDNPSYYKIIDAFRKRTGLGAVINTSFNMHEEPIVCSPEDAIRAFRLGHLDYLAMGDYLVPSPEPIRHPLKPATQVEREPADAHA